ncbi:MAG TPA: hypothetical protein VFU50_18070 [Terriglobales bacterium]|nr:hypothetical protein [Terriglobales bacterium]
MFIDKAVVFLAVLLLFPLGSFSQTNAVARGQYSALGQDASWTDSWTLSLDSKGNYEVTTAVGKKPQEGSLGQTVQQTFGFDRKWQPLAFRVRLGKQPRQIALDCTFSDTLADCQSDFNGTQSNAKLSIERPYCFMPNEFYGLDFAWFLAGIGNQVLKASVSSVDVPLVWLDEDDTDKNKIKLTIPEKQTVRVIGTEKIAILGHEVQARKLQTSDNFKLWISQSGLLVAFAVSENGEDADLH